MSRRLIYDSGNHDGCVFGFALFIICCISLNQQKMNQTSVTANSFFNPKVKPSWFCGLSTDL